MQKWQGVADKKGEVAFLYIYLFLRGGGLNKILSKYLGARWLTRANTVYAYNLTLKILIFKGKVFLKQCLTQCNTVYLEKANKNITTPIKSTELVLLFTGGHVLVFVNKHVTLFCAN